MNVAFLLSMCLLWTFESTLAENFAKETLHCSEWTSSNNASVMNVSEIVHTVFTGSSPSWNTSLSSSTSNASLLAVSQSSLDNRQRSLLQRQPSSRSNEEEDCRLTSSQQERYYNAQRRMWILTENDLEEIEDDIQLVVDCASQRDVILLNTLRRIEPPRTITITKQLTLSAFSRSFNNSNQRIPRTRRRVSITCPSPRESVFDFRHPNVTIGNIEVEDCALEEGSAIIGSPCDTEGTVGRIRVHHVSFENNVNLHNASVMFWGESSCFALHLTDVVLRNNSCGVLGCVQLPREVILENIEAFSNQRVAGSGMDVSVFQGEDVSVNASNLQVSNNSCKAFSVIRSSLRIFDSSFVGNSFASLEEGRSSEGGVIRTYASSLILNSCSFLENSATSGGVVFAHSSSLEMSDTRLEGNAAEQGGGLSLDSSYLTATRTVFIRNSVERSGGAIVALNCTLNFNTSRILNNFAGVGGGLYLESIQLVSTGTRFANNRARRSGGAVFVHYNSGLEFTNCTFLMNSCVLNGGGMHCASVSLNIQGSNFRRNQARNGGAISSELTNSVISTSSFRNNSAANSGGSLNFAFQTNATVLNSAFEGDSAGGGGSIRAEDSSISGSGLSFNEAQSRGRASAISVHSSELELQRSRINGSLPDSLYALFGAGSTMRLTEVEFEDNPSTAATVLSSNASFHGCRVTANSGSNGGVFELLSSNTSIENTTFTGNSAANVGGAVYQAQGRLQISNSVFFNNSAPLGGALAIHDGNTTIFGSNFTMNRARLGGAIRCIRCNSSAVGTILLGNTAENDGGAFYLSPRGVARFRESQFVNNICTENGGGIYGENASLLELLQVSFRDNRATIDGGGIFVIHSNISSDGSSFVNNTGMNGGGIAMSNTPALIRGSRFSRCSANEGGAIHAMDSSNSSILQSLFDRNRAVSGGALVLVNSQLNGSATVFTRNRASNGGGLFMDQTSRLSFVNFTFFRNQALETGGAISLRTEDTVTIACQIRNSLFQNNSARRGGALHFERRALRFENCTSLNNVCSGVAILNTSFLNNEAEVAGAAIQVNSVSAVRVACSDHRSQEAFIPVPQFLQLPMIDNRRHCSTWRGNQIRTTDHAEGTVGSYASRANISIATQGTSPRTSNGDLVLEDVRSGDRLPNISLIAVDEFGNGPASLIRGVLVANLTSPDEFFRGTIPLSMPNGTGVFTDVVGFVQPEIYHLNISFNSEDVEEVVIEVQVRDCRIGEQRTPDFVLCQPCDTQSYNFEPNGNGSCIACPDHSTCAGTFVVPEAGYWHSSPCSSRIQECLHEEACQSKDRIEALNNLSDTFQACSLSEEELEQYNDQQCSTGYSGALCGACANSYGRYGLFSCAKCLHTVATSVFILLAAAWSLFLAGIVIRGSLPVEANRRSTRRRLEDPESQVRRRSSGSGSRSVVPVNFQMVEMMITGRVPPEVLAGEPYPAPQPEPSDLDSLNIQKRFAIESFKITVNYLQVTAVAATINVVWTDAMSSLLTLAENLGGITTDTVTGSVDCIVSWDSPGLQALIRVLVALLVPIALCVFLAFFWTSYAIQQRQTGEFLLKRVLLSVIVVIYLTYLGLTKMAVKVFFCVEVHDFQAARMEFSTDQYWAMDTNLKCYEGYHIGLGAIGVFVLIFITVGVPLMSALLAFRCTRARGNSEECWVSDTIGFMYKAFKEKFAYWESVVMSRKSLLSIVAVFSYPLGGDIQSIMATLILIFALFLQMNCRPYKEEFSVLNFYEAVSLFISSVTFILGMCFEQGRSSYLVRILLTVCLCFINTVFSVFMVLVFSRYSTGYMRSVLENEGVPIEPNMKWFTVLKLYVLTRITCVKHRYSTEEHVA